MAAREFEFKGYAFTLDLRDQARIEPVEHPYELKVRAMMHGVEWVWGTSMVEPTQEAIEAGCAELIGEYQRQLGWASDEKARIGALEDTLGQAPLP